MKLVQGQSYQATISLGTLEAMAASNDMIAGKLRGAGFTGVSVTGSGSTRSASGTWSKATGDFPLPSQVTRVW